MSWRHIMFSVTSPGGVGPLEMAKVAQLTSGLGAELELLVGEKGVSLAVVAEALGHSSTPMVERHYGDLAPSHVAATIRQKLPAFGVELTGKVRNLRP